MIPWEIKSKSHTNGNQYATSFAYNASYMLQYYLYCIYILNLVLILSY